MRPGEASWGLAPEAEKTGIVKADLSRWESGGHLSSNRAHASATVGVTRGSLPPAFPGDAGGEVMRGISNKALWHKIVPGCYKPPDGLRASSRKGSLFSHTRTQTRPPPPSGFLHTARAGQ
jgi:hypothetical protein